MHGLLPFILAFSPLIATGAERTRVTPGDFRAWFASAVEGDLEIPREVEARARRFRYIFIAGFSNERMGGYFAQNMKELRAQGVSKKAIHVIAPPSSGTVEENRDAVRRQIVEVAEKGPEKLVIIAHSRGACDAMAFALENPEFVREHVEAMFLVQGVFGGTGLADYLTGDAPPVDRDLPWRFRALARLFVAMEHRLVSRGKHAGLPDLSRWSSRDYWSRMTSDHAEAVPVVGPRTFYVTSEARPSHLRLFKKATGRYLSTYFGPNDGLVAPEDQSLPGIGTVLATLDAGHSDLTNRFPSARARRGLRKALIQGIVMAVGQDAPEGASEQAP